MTTTELKTSAFLVDLYPLPAGSARTSDFRRLAQNNINHALFSTDDDDPASARKVQVYLLTSSSDDNVSRRYDLNRTLPGSSSSSEDDDPEAAETFVIRNDNEVASFYQAKQRLDDQEIRDIRLLCGDARRAFWTQVCQLLFTPVHDWSVKTLHCCCCGCSSSFGGKGYYCYDSLGESEEEEERRENVNCGCCLGNKGQRCRSLGERESLSAATIVVANGCVNGEKEAVLNHHHHHSDASAYSSFSSSSSPSPSRQDLQPRPAEPTLDETRVRVQRFLQTLPSLLGLPEVERSAVLRGAGAGFAHGFSTRRGGVTSVSTLCAMNAVYTDKKPDAPLVVEENRRRLATVGGFNHTNFHITRVEHGHKVWAVGRDPQPPLKFDALVTDRRDVTIAAAGADCIVLLFVDPVAQAIGAAHAGWMGTAQRVAARVVERMTEEYGCRPEDIRVALGPGVRLGCFSVLKEEGKLFSDIHPDCVSDFVEPGPKFRRHRIDGSRFQRFRKNHVVSDSGGGGGGGGSAASGPFSFRPRRIEPELCSRGGRKVSPPSDLPARLGDLDNKVEADCEEAFSPGVTRVGAVRAGEDLLGRPGRAAEDFRVQLVPRERLRPKEPRAPRDASRQWVPVDLQLANYHVLLQAGVKAEHIDTRTSHCTACNPELYFSYERDGFPFGNQIGFVCMPE